MNIQHVLTSYLSYMDVWSILKSSLNIGNWCHENKDILIFWKANKICYNLCRWCIWTVRFLKKCSFYCSKGLVCEKISRIFMIMYAQIQIMCWLCIISLNLKSTDISMRADKDKKYLFYPTRSLKGQYYVLLMHTFKFYTMIK